MTQALAGRGDPVKLLELLWRMREGPRRGPKSKLTLDEIVAAATAIADAEGIDAATTRRVAQGLGISAMSFYTHVPSKSELHDLMLDHVLAPLAQRPEGWETMDWRARLGSIAEAQWNLFLAHPWILQFQTHRPVMGPNTLALNELALSAVDGIGLSEIEMDLAVTGLMDLVTGTVRHAARARLVEEATGMNDRTWWRRIAPFLDTLDFSPFPVLSRVGPVTGAEYGAGDPRRTFEFALERFLDGLAMLIERRA